MNKHLLLHQKLLDQPPLVWASLKVGSFLGSAGEGVQSPSASAGLDVWLEQTAQS